MSKLDTTLDDPSLHLRYRLLFVTTYELSIEAGAELLASGKGGSDRDFCERGGAPTKKTAKLAPS